MISASKRAFASSVPPRSASSAVSKARISIFSSLPRGCHRRQRSLWSRRTCSTCSTHSATSACAAVGLRCRVGPGRAGRLAAGGRVHRHPDVQFLDLDRHSRSTPSTRVRVTNREVPVGHLERLDDDRVLVGVEVADGPFLGDRVGDVPGAQRLALLVHQDHAHVLGRRPARGTRRGTT